MTRVQIVTFVSLVVVGIFGALWWHGWRLNPAGAGAGASAPAPASSTEPIVGFSVTSGVETRYLDDANRFSFGIPDGFRAEEVPAANEAGAVAILVQNAAREGVEVVARPLAKGSPELSEAAVRATLPNEVVTNVVPVVVAGVPALSFDTDSTLWDGTDHEVWFVYGAYLYQLSTYTRDAALADFIRSSWRWGI
ncbi:hypothetical protein HY091_03510 [Candidatus Kaiserbacteria bacterium]|nr:hypothetical protein [Candidatus Kaiserbacteria bacterium]